MGSACRSKNLGHILGGEIFVFTYSKLSYIYSSSYISCLIFTIPYTGLAFLLVLGSLSLYCIIQPSTSGPAFA